MVDFEITLVKLFGWSLREIDETAVETLFPFYYRYIYRFSGYRPTYCDEVGWL